MTIREWLASRTPVPPDTLGARLRECLEADLDRDSREVPERFLAVAEQMTASMIREGRTSRDAALDLLTADALVTYAFEAAADEPALLAGRARAALDALSALA